MAEIEFERRGTPVWVVLLGLIILALVIWYFVAGRQPAPTTATTPTPATTPAPAAAPGAAAASPATPAPAADRAPLVLYTEFVGRPAPSAAGVPTYVADGLRVLADAMEKQYPANGVQVNLVRAMSDSLRIAGVPARRQTDMAQAAFFAAGFAMNKGNPSGQVTHAASQVQLDRTLQQQVTQIRNFFQQALEELKSPTGAAPSGLPAGAPAPKAAAPAGAPAGATKRP